MKTYARMAYFGVAWLIVAMILGQAFVAGRALFAGTDWSTHRDLGHTIVLLPTVLLVVAAVGQLPRSVIRLAAILFGLVVVQAEVFAAIRHQMPGVAALHPVLALLVFTTSLAVAWNARSVIRVPRHRQIVPAAMRTAL
jgi:hypothetical protein